MREHHVGDLVVVEEPEVARVPCGMITDRDIAVAVVAKGIDPDAVTVAEVMTRRLVVGRGDTSMAALARLMQQNDVRRIPIVDEGGGLIDIVTADDVVDYAAGEMVALASMISHEKQRHLDAEFRNAVLDTATQDILARVMGELGALAQMISGQQRLELETRRV